MNENLINTLEIYLSTYNNGKTLDIRQLEKALKKSWLLQKNMNIEILKVKNIIGRLNR